MNQSTMFRVKSIACFNSRIITRRFFSSPVKQAACEGPGRLMWRSILSSQRIQLSSFESRIMKEYPKYSSPNDLVSIIWAFSRVRYQIHEDLYRVLETKISLDFEEVSGRDFVSLLWALPKMNCTPSSSMLMSIDRVGIRVLRNMDRGSHVNTAISGISKIYKEPSKKLVFEMMDAVHRNLDRLRPTDMQLIVLGFRKMRIRLIDLDAQKMLSILMRDLTSFNLSDFSRTLVIIHNLELMDHHLNERFWKDFEIEFEKHVDELGASYVSTFSWLRSELRWRISSNLNNKMQMSILNCHDFKPISIFASTQLKLKHDLDERVVLHMQESFNDNLDHLNAIDLGAAAYVFGRHNSLISNECVINLEHAADRLLPTMPPSTLATIIWGFASLNYRPSHEFQTKSEKILAAKMKDMHYLSVCSVLSAYCSFESSNSIQFLKTVELYLMENIKQFDSVHLVEMLAYFVKIEYPLSRDVLPMIVSLTDLKMLNGNVAATLLISFTKSMYKIPPRFMDELVKTILYNRMSCSRFTTFLKSCVYQGKKTTMIYWCTISRIWMIFVSTIYPKFSKSLAFTIYRHKLSPN